jgi:heme iron utilization protein
MTDDPKTASLLEARRTFEAARTGALSVLDFDTGGPLTALVNVALTPECEPVILTSTLSRHTQCLDRDGRASIMVTGLLPAEGDPLTGFRATLTGAMTRAADKATRQVYLAHHPYAELYADFGDFGFWKMSPLKLYVVAGFGRVYNYDASLMKTSATGPQVQSG